MHCRTPASSLRLTTWSGFGCAAQSKAGTRHQRAVGAGVGADVGTFETVGVTVGLDVGTAVGECVGRGVGTGVGVQSSGRPASPSWHSSPVHW